MDFRLKLARLGRGDEADEVPSVFRQAMLLGCSG